MSLISKLTTIAAAGNAGGDPAKYLITYQSSGKIWDIENDYADVTSTFLPSNTTSWAGSNEHMFHGWQDDGYRSKYIGFGGWGRYGAIGGAIWDINNASSQWTGYNNYDGTVFTFGGSGNAIVTRIVPLGNSKNFFWFRVEDNLEVGVNRITNPTSSNNGSQVIASNSIQHLASWGDVVVYQLNTAPYTLRLASFYGAAGSSATAASTSLVSTSGTLSGYSGSGARPAISKTGNVIVVYDGAANSSTGAVRVFDDHNIAEYNGSSKVLGNGTQLAFSSSVRSVATGVIDEAVAVSDDDRWIAASYRRSTSPYYGIGLWDRNSSYAFTDVTVPVGAGTNARPRGIVFYPDNDTFFVSGYANAQCLECSASSGSYTRNFASFGANAESKMGSSMDATVLPPDWTDGY